MPRDSNSDGNIIFNLSFKVKNILNFTNAKIEKYKKYYRYDFHI
jgi:hypothetical protein